MDKKVKLFKLIQQIEDTKVQLYNLMHENDYDLIDKEIVELSQLLDKLLLKYYNIK
ncbi:Spo0E family sporulation regulatory protein-aspartic acid phosphatase [Tissierella sp. MSJ-40]|uniref:Spo0E family sporulation regulatory protein-aspartic acid phosphatase n=1 Tax=Tissierella simiarum TaxID=2841534 RepID=A0ABS6E0Z0_9FIRM|nr:Spo0E family sporulation regulatory protein-aspartic acid phosphatase [Tissierella simiarum]MBU5436558.1 Spo0E family sporulation regulatory protein-aspartic acid phosphatase [Tissierella simiarum]